MKSLTEAKSQARREAARQIWQAGVDAVRPENCLPEWFAAAGNWPVHFPPLGGYRQIVVVGGGKAGAAMSLALEQTLAARGVAMDRVQGVVNVPDDCVRPLCRIRLHPSRAAGVNEPTEAALAGTREILQLARQAGPEDLLLCLISGGGSALLPAPADGISLADKQLATRLLHQCGADIREMNAVRKHLSQIKGGGLVRQFAGRFVLGLIISDVVGDPLDVIASGPTAVDSTTFAEALAVIEKYGLRQQMPAAVVERLERGRTGALEETLKEYPRDADGRPLVENVVLANNERAASAACQAAVRLGFEVHFLGSKICGDTAAAAADHVRRVIQLRKTRTHRMPAAIISGGETTVRLEPDSGLGGRNQEFVLAFLETMARMEDKRGGGMLGVTILCGGTDGEDGPTDAAGACADDATLERARQAGLDAADYLRRHDSYHFFQQTGDLLKTGFTHTNVMDLRVILVEPDAD